KIDSGWPNVSDVSLPVNDLGVWKEFRITLAQLIENGNSLASGKATLATVSNLFVVEPSAAMNVSFDNVRIEGKASSGVEEFAKLPLFTIYGDNTASGLKIESYNPAGQITASETDEGSRGKILKVVKTGAEGNVFFNVIDGPANLNHWNATGELVF